MYVGWKLVKMPIFSERRFYTDQFVFSWLSAALILRAQACHHNFSQIHQFLFLDPTNQSQAIPTNFKQIPAIPNEENYLTFSHLQHPTSISGLMVRLRSVPDNLEWKIKSWAFRVIVQVARKRIVTQAPHKKES